MHSVIDLIHERGWSSRPWLILGKGPSFARRNTINLPDYCLLGLNHASLHLPVHLAHMTDLDAAQEILPQLPQETAVVMPWFPHTGNRPGKRSLDVLLVGRDLKPTGPICSYNSTVSLHRNPHLPLIRVRYFSAVAAVNVLGRAGVKKVRLLGVDGGSLYSPEFDTKTLLANGRQDFDIQFGEIEKARTKFNMDLQYL